MTNAAIKVPFTPEESPSTSQSSAGSAVPSECAPLNRASPGGMSWAQIRDYVFFKRPSPEVIREWARKVAERQRAFEISRDGEAAPEWQLSINCRYGICRGDKVSVHLRPDGRGTKLDEMAMGQVYRVTARSASGSWLQIYLDDMKLKGWIEVSRHIFITLGEYKLLKSADTELKAHFVRALYSSITDAEGQRRDGARSLLRLDADGSSPSPV